MAGYRIKQIETLYEGWRKLFRLTVQMPDGRTMAREVLNSTDAAVVLPYDPERRRVILVRQFRAPVMLAEGHADLLEAIAGLLDGDDARNLRPARGHGGGGPAPRGARAGRRRMVGARA